MNWPRTLLDGLAIPEHGLVWTFIICPVAGLFAAGINCLLG